MQHPSIKMFEKPLAMSDGLRQNRYMNTTTNPAAELTAGMEIHYTGDRSNVECQYIVVSFDDRMATLKEINTEETTKVFRCEIEDVYNPNNGTRLFTQASRVRFLEERYPGIDFS
jgi:hypothetical protein